MDDKKFESRSKDGYILTRLAADIVFYIEQPLTEIADAVLYSYEVFLSICEDCKLNWYITDSMSGYESVTNKTLNIPYAWLGPKARKRQLIGFEVKHSDALFDAAIFSFDINGEERNSPYFGDESSYIRLVFPASFLDEKHDRFLQVTKDFADRIPFISGHAGFVIERSLYDEEEGYRAAYAKAVRYSAVDIGDISNAAGAIFKNRIKGVNWLTIITEQMLNEIDGVAKKRAISDGMANFHLTKNGVIIQAGDTPTLGDQNRGDRALEYRAVYKMVKRFQAKTIEDYRPFNLGSDDEEERTEAWLRRLDN
jgi:hypothetical protein